MLCLSIYIFKCNDLHNLVCLISLHRNSALQVVVYVLLHPVSIYFAYHMK